GGPLKSVDLPRCPGVPVLQSLWRQPQSQRMRVKGGTHRLPCLPPLSFPPRAARVGYVVLPIHPWEQELLGPSPPWRRDSCLLQIPLDTFPPKIHQGCEGRYLLADFLHGVVTCSQLLLLGAHFDGVDSGL